MNRSVRPARLRYMAPELFANPEPQPGHDLYAAGVTLYHLLTRKYPYGEIEPFQLPKFGEPARRRAGGRKFPAGWRISCSRPLPGRPGIASKLPRSSCSRSGARRRPPDRGAGKTAAGAAQPDRALESGGGCLDRVESRVIPDSLALKCEA